MATIQPKNGSDTRQGTERDGGPASWLVPLMESSAARMVPRDQAVSERSQATAERSAVRAALRSPATAAARTGSVLSPGASNVLTDMDRDFWRRTIQEYHDRKAQHAGHSGLAAPAIVGQNNWVPIGPAVVARGQAVGRPALGGRTSGLAIASGGSRIYAATANGGVFRSDDGGKSWRSTMDGFDLNPASFAATSLCCGAIAISPTNSDRVYVGTGEGDVDAIFSSRLTNALPSYRGIGPIRSDDGGATWVSESSTPSLAGFAFYALAVDPANAEHVVAATTNGLYERTISAGAPSWVRRRTGSHPSVVVAAAGGATTFYAAQWGGPVVRSTNGSTWTTLGTGFPTTSIGRVALGVQADNANVLYAVVCNVSGALVGIYRLDGGTGAWRIIASPPPVLPTDSNGNSQGDYDLCIAVDPSAANQFYVGGSYADVDPYPGSIWRCNVATVAGGGFTMTSTSIGTHAHADVHVLTFPPSDATRLYTGTDGGCFVNLDPSGAGQFEARNTGLASLCTNYMGMSATDPAVIFCGLQDNGTARYTGDELWRDVWQGDGGYCVVHPTDPFTALVYANGKVSRTTTGGRDWGDWTEVIAPPWGIMAEPLVGAPGSTTVAFGAFAVTTATPPSAFPAVYISDNFGAAWPALTAPTVALPSGSGGVYSMVFATSDRLFIGTTAGRVFRADRAGGTWTLTRIDNVAAGALGLIALISDIAIDWSDAAGQSVYVCLGGFGDRRHVWRFDGTSWQARSGAGATGLLDVEHNAIVVDPVNTATVFVGADLGVWRSADSGVTWTPLERGLPDAPVFDLQIHASTRLLRASTHGRGLYEYRLDPPSLGGVELYMRDTDLDLARGVSTDGRDNPTQWPRQAGWHWLSPNIKVDAPTSAGYQTPTTSIDFFDFHENLVDLSKGVETIAPPIVVTNRVYALIHNRGPIASAVTTVTAAVTNASTVLRPLPVGYAANVVAGTPLPGPDWTTLGAVTLTNLRPGFPQVAEFDLPSTALSIPASLPGQSHYCTVIFVHSTDDPFTATERNVDLLTLAERKVAQKNLHVVPFVGVPPSSKIPRAQWARLEVAGHLFKGPDAIDLVFNLAACAWPLSVVAPEALLNNAAIERSGLKRADATVADHWWRQHRDDAQRLFNEGKYAEADLKHLLQSMEQVAGRPLLILPPRKQTILRDLPIRPDEMPAIFLRIECPLKARIGAGGVFDVLQRSSRTGEVQGEIGRAHV